ncbi:MAG: ribosome maturation factor [Ferruginibacter sp.]|nr:ribosome maturation factor [Ferruginibacter sp.]
MSVDTALNTVQGLLQPLLDGDTFLVDLKVKPTNNYKIYIDADNGLPLEKCIKINRALYKAIEEKELFPDGDFSLEVSSPGVSEPLKLIRQYKKNIGRFVEVTKKDETKLEGQLLDASEEEITIEKTEGKGKKEVKIQLKVPVSEVKHTIVQVKF